MMQKDITGILLAGGKSKRMGTNKSFLRLNGKYIIEYVHEKLAAMFSKVLIIANSPEGYFFLNSEIYHDIYKNKGPLGGIHTGLYNSNTEKNFVISCDMPLVSSELMEFIIKSSVSSDITVARSEGFIQNLCGLYKKNCLKKAEEILREFDDSTCKVSKLLRNTKTNIIEEQDIPFSIENQFLNLNKPADYDKLRGLGQKKIQ